MLVAVPAAAAAAQTYSELPKEKQTAVRLAAIVVPVVLKEAAKCVGYHYVHTWALKAVATGAAPKCCTYYLAKGAAWWTAGASNTVGGAIVHAAAPAAAAAKAFVVANALPLAIGGAVALCLVGLGAWAWRRRKKRRV